MVTYTEAFDVFQIVDHLSGWHENSRKEYYQYFSKSFNMSQSDKMMLETYRRIRSKYHKEYPAANDSLFSEEAISGDVFTRTFAKVKTVDKALSILKKNKRVNNTDLKEIVKVYKHFKMSISKLVRESAILKDEAQRLNKIFKKKKFSSNIKKLDKFFDLPTNKIKGGRIKLVWWPPTERPIVDFQSGRVILRINPIKHTKYLDEDFMLKALIHSLIVSLGKNKKENLSKVFMDTCPKIKERGIAKYLWFEEPLLDALSRYYLPYLGNKKKFNPYTVRSESPWVDVFSKYLFGLTQHSIGRKTKFTREFVTISASYCSMLQKL
mgnify:CR=1 FL=1